MDAWTEAWPTEPGFYWFFGWKFKPYPDDESPRMWLVDVWQVANGLAYVVDGHFMYPKEGARGKWMQAFLPEPPVLNAGQE